MAVRSWPPSSAITTRPPARPMSSWVSCPKPANVQWWRSRNTSQHSTIMSKKCCGSPYAMLTFGRDVVSSQWRLVTLHCVETSRHQNHIWTEMLSNGHHHIPVHTHPAQWKSAHSIRCISECIYTPAVRQSLALFYCCIISFLTPEMHILDVYLKAVRYSTSPIGGSTPPVHAMFTLKPLPPPDPTCGDTGWQQRITLSHCLCGVSVHAL